MPWSQIGCGLYPPAPARPTELAGAPAPAPLPWPTAAADFQQALRANPTWDLPGMFVSDRLTDRVPLPVQTMVKEVQDERRQRDDLLRAQVDAYYAGKDLAYCGPATTTASRCAILGITTRYSTVLQHSMEELAAARALRATKCRSPSSLTTTRHTPRVGSSGGVQARLGDPDFSDGL